MHTNTEHRKQHKPGQRENGTRTTVTGKEEGLHTLRTCALSQKNELLP